VREVGNLVDRDSRTVQVKLAIEDSDAVLPSVAMGVQRPQDTAVADAGKPTEADPDAPTKAALNPDAAVPGATAPGEPQHVLRHGMFVRGEIVVETVDDEIVLPIDVLDVGPEGTKVWTA